MLGSAVRVRAVPMVLVKCWIAGGFPRGPENWGFEGQFTCGALIMLIIVSTIILTSIVSILLCFVIIRALYRVKRRMKQLEFACLNKYGAEIAAKVPGASTALDESGHLKVLACEIELSVDQIVEDLACYVRDIGTRHATAERFLRFLYHCHVPKSLPKKQCCSSSVESVDVMIENTMTGLAPMTSRLAEAVFEKFADDHVSELVDGADFARVFDAARSVEGGAKLAPEAAALALLPGSPKLISHSEQQASAVARAASEPAHDAAGEAQPQQLQQQYAHHHRPLLRPPPGLRRPRQQSPSTAAVAGTTLQGQGHHRTQEIAKHSRIAQVLSL